MDSEPASLTPDKPFFTYFATGATHAPHHVPETGSRSSRAGSTPAGTVYREETFARQKKLGVVPPDARLAAKADGIKDWNVLTPMRSGCSRGRWRSTPRSPRTPTHEIGRVVQAIEDLGELDNTMIIYLVGDNGASAEGGMVGMFNEMTVLQRRAETVPDMLKSIDKWGNPETFPHMAAGWAVAGNTPFKWTKQLASNFGGTRNPLVIHWPPGSRPRARFAASSSTWSTSRPPSSRRRAYLSRRTSTASPRRRWKASAWCTRSTTPRPRTATRRSTSRSSATAPSTTTAGWPPPSTRSRGKRGRDMRSPTTYGSCTTSTRISASPRISPRQEPAKLKEMQALFMKEAKKYRVLPIDDRVIERASIRLRRAAPT